MRFHLYFHGNTKMQKSYLNSLNLENEGVIILLYKRFAQVVKSIASICNMSSIKEIIFKMDRVYIVEG